MPCRRCMAIVYPYTIHMAPYKVLILVALGALTLAVTGCSTFDKGASQEVTILSFPAGADVTIGGENVGKTPLDISLRRKIPHEVRLSLNGYREAKRTLMPVVNEKGKAFVQFGLAKEAGYYNDLTPNPLEVNLLPDVLPTSRGPDPFAEMAAAILLLDEMRENGELSPTEHKYRTQRVIEFYTR